MGDCQIVLRFFALRDEGMVKGSMRSILDKCMERNLNIDKARTEEMLREYHERLKLSDDLFDGRPFQLDRDSRPSESMYDAVMVAAHKLWPQREALLRVKRKIQRRYWSMLNTPEKIEQFSGRANTAGDVRQRISSMTQLFEAALNDA
jgi:hypothetical protein